MCPHDWAQPLSGLVKTTGTITQGGDGPSGLAPYTRPSRPWAAERRPRYDAIPLGLEADFIHRDTEAGPSRLRWDWRI